MNENESGLSMISVQGAYLRVLDSHETFSESGKSPLTPQLLRVVEIAGLSTVTSRAWKTGIAEKALDWTK
jgi:hypothetical protein